MLRPIFVGLWCLMSAAFAASIGDQFEVAKTKLLYLLSSQQTSESLAYITEVGDPFSNTEYEFDWQFWSAVAFSRAGNLPDAESKFETLAKAGYENPQFDLEYGLFRLKQKQYAVAREPLSRWVSENPESLHGVYYLALTEYDLKNFTRARTLLANAVARFDGNADQNFQFDQAIYLYAATLRNLNDYAEASCQAKRLLTWPNGSRYEAAARDLLSAIDIEQKQSQKLSASIQLTTAVDSNVALLAESDGLDGRAALQADMSYRVQPWLIPSYQLFLSRHVTASDYDLLINTFALTTTGMVAAKPVGAEYQLAINQLSGEPWLTRHSLSAWFRAGVFTHSLSAAYQQYTDSDNVVFDVASNWQPMSGVSAVQIAMQPFTTLQTATNLDIQSVAFGVNARAMRFVAQWQLAAELQADYVIYAPDGNKDSALNAAVTLQASRQISQSLTASTKIDVIGTAIKPDTLNYARTVASASVVWRF